MAWWQILILAHIISVLWVIVCIFFEILGEYRKGRDITINHLSTFLLAFIPIMSFAILFLYFEDWYRKNKNKVIFKAKKNGQV